MVFFGARARASGVGAERERSGGRGVIFCAPPCAFFVFALDRGLGACRCVVVEPFGVFSGPIACCGGSGGRCGGVCGGLGVHEEALG
eukprot:3936098-Rhodomonas_salina.1